mgnify:FL=1
MRALIIMVVMFWSACQQKGTQQNPVQNSQQLKENMMDANRIMHEHEEVDIENYIKRAGWEMTTSPTGLRYHVYEEGDGKVGEEGMVAIFNFETKLINGKVCYSSEENGTKQFLIGKPIVERGLDEAMQLLKVGDRAKLILPSHLAFGLVGDDNCVPRKAILIYDVQIIDFVKPTKIN